MNPSLQGLEMPESRTSPCKSLEAQQLADFVQQLDLENQALRECISRCADTLLSESAVEDRDSAGERRKGLAVLLEDEVSMDSTSRSHVKAKQLLQSRVLKSSCGRAPVAGRALSAGQLEQELQRLSPWLEDQLREQKMRLTSLDMEVDALQRDLAATQERQQALESTQLEERLRHDALCLCMKNAALISFRVALAVLVKHRRHILRECFAETCGQFKDHV